MNKAVVIAGALLLAGCSSAPPEWLTGTRDCNYIGCATGGLQVYPNEEFGAQRQPRRWHNWEWGETSRAMDPNTREYAEARRREAEHARAQGLDPWGRPFNTGY